MNDTTRNTGTSDITNPAAGTNTSAGDSICKDLRAEYAQFAELCGRTTAASHWQQVGCELAHLMFFDEAGLLAATDADAFARDAAAVNVRLAGGESMDAIVRTRYGTLDAQSLLAAWIPVSNRLVDRLSSHDAAARLPWYGPTMTTRSFAVARLRDCWARGQAVCDATGLSRAATPRLEHIVQFAVSTFTWSFANRHRAMPAKLPHVQLNAPDGSVWEWGDSSSPEFVRGTAVDFCLLSVQRRKLSEVALQSSPGYARDWLVSLEAPTSTTEVA